MSFLILYLSNDTGKVILSLLNITLLMVPLVSSFFCITYFYDSKSFIEFLLSQPVSRAQVFWSKLASLWLFMSFLYAGGVLIPLIKEVLNPTLWVLLISGVLLSMVFISLAVLVGTVFDDRVKGVSFLLGLWLYLTVLHDGVILAVVYLFKDYPLEGVVLALALVNPVDLARIAVVINMDVAALMGLSEALFREVLGSLWGLSLAFAFMVLWFALPAFLASLLFKRKAL